MPGAITILDGAVGTRLGELGADLEAPEWSANVLESDPELILRVHRQYAEAGAEVLTANTFRTTPRRSPGRWRERLVVAMSLAREAARSRNLRVAGSIAPAEDCYQPDLSPSDAWRDHAAIAGALADAGADILLCETFPHVGEGIAACKVALETGKPVWFALTAGPDADLLKPEEMGRAARMAGDAGVQAVLVNCVPAIRTLEFVEAIARAGIPFGAYANAGSTRDGIGWYAGAPGAEVYAQLAQSWVDAGATIVGSCCGTSPDHTRALADRFR